MQDQRKLDVREQKQLLQRVMAPAFPTENKEKLYEVSSINNSVKTVYLL